MSSKRGTGNAGVTLCAGQEIAMKTSRRRVQIAPMRFVYSSKMRMRVRRMISFVLLFISGLPVISSAQKSAGVAPEKPVAPSFRLSDITTRAGIQFEHTISREKEYLIESMPGGVLLLDYDGDGWLDIYFTNSPSVDMAIRGQKATSALYRNNHDGTFTDVTD